MRLTVCVLTVSLHPVQVQDGAQVRREASDDGKREGSKKKYKSVVLDHTWFTPPPLWSKTRPHFYVFFRTLPKEKIVALTNLEDGIGWKINDVDQLQEKQVASILILQEEVKRLWCMGTPRELLKVSDSMPRRLQCVIDAGGEMTKY